jgi:hypothetical protein
MGVRAFDFNVWYDPGKCHYSYNAFRKLVYRKANMTNDAYCKAPGFRVLAIPVRCLGLPQCAASCSLFLAGK